MIMTLASVDGDAASQSIKLRGNICISIGYMYLLRIRE